MSYGNTCLLFIRFIYLTLYIYIYLHMHILCAPFDVTTNGLLHFCMVGWPDNGAAVASMDDTVLRLRVR